MRKMGVNVERVKKNGLGWKGIGERKGDNLKACYCFLVI